jgi:hypothetical protein
VRLRFWFQFTPNSERSRGRIIKQGETAIMNKSLLSQVLDGAAFPTIMLAVAVSVINVGPHQRDLLHEGKRPFAEVQVGDRVEQKVEKAGEK